MHWDAALAVVEEDLMGSPTGPLINRAQITTVVPEVVGLAVAAVAVAEELPTDDSNRDVAGGNHSFSESIYPYHHHVDLG